jgi:hypothetical protein
MGQRPPVQVNRPELPILPGENRILIPGLPNVPSVLPVSHIHTPCHAGRSGPGWTRLTYVLFGLYVNNTTTPSRHVELAQYAKDTALIATSRDPSLLVGYLEAYLGRLELCLRDWGIAISVSESTAVVFAKAARRARQPRPVQFLGEPMEWVETARFLGGVSLDTRLT